MNREEALNLLREYTKNENLMKHALAVEAGMKAYARKFGEDEEKWGIAGLLHDMDWEQNPEPEKHTLVTEQILREKCYPEEIITAIKTHSDSHNIERKTLMDKALYAVDELTGLIIAVALVRPTKSIYDVELKSIKKKWKDKLFAKGADREVIEKGAKELGIELDEHIKIVLETMKTIAKDLELEGNKN